MKHALVPGSSPDRRGRSGSPVFEFECFFRASYRDLLKVAMYAGATWHEADEAAQVAMQEIMRRWCELDHPLAYARRATISNVVKAKTRDLDRDRRQLVKRNEGTPEGREDPGLTVWCDHEWVVQILETLPAGQRDVMAFIIDGFTPTEIASLLGRSPAAVRQSLHAARLRLKTALLHEQQPASGKATSGKEDG